jgi:TonB family protein
MRVLGVLFLAAGTLAIAQGPPAAQVPPATELHNPIHLDAAAATALTEKRVPAVYPEPARVRGIQGDVVLDVLISELGDVKEATVASGDPALTPAALQSIKQWHYKPYMLDGKPVPVATQVTYGFHIKAPPAPPPLGSFRAGKYEDEFFGISYPLSTEWVRETNLVRKRVDSQAGAASSSQILLAALRVPPKSDGLVADSSFVMLASKQPMQGDAKEHLGSITTDLLAEKLAKPRGGITSLTFAGLTAYRADFRPSDNSGVQYQSVLCTMVKGYLLQWNFLAASEASLDEAVATVSGITPLLPTPGSVAPGTVAPGTAAPESAPAPSTQPVAVRVSSGVAAGMLVKKVAPQYPPAAKAAHIQGVVILHARIDKDGNVIDLEAIVGPVELVPASVSAVRQWKYKPYLLKGEPIELDTTIEVRYVLERY